MHRLQRKIACAARRANGEEPNPAVTYPAADALGKRKALLVGINYVGTRAQLEGCINDVLNQKKALTGYYGFSEKDILLLSDDQKDPGSLPTKANIERGFAWLFDGAAAGDELVFHYSGHGSQVVDTTGREPDGMSECICPLDCIGGRWPDTVIVDDEIYRVFYEGLPAGVRCVCLFDSCHSGTIGDLPYTRDLPLRRPRYLPPPPPMQEALDRLPRRAAREREVAVESAAVGPAAAAGGGGGGGSWWFFAGCQPAACCRAPAAAAGAAPAPAAQRALLLPVAAGGEAGDGDGKLLWVFSGCQDDQYSGDVYVDELHQGAFSWALFKRLAKAEWHTRYGDLLDHILEEMRADYPDQTPALSSSCAENLRRWYLEAATNP